MILRSVLSQKTMAFNVFGRKTGFLIITIFCFSGTIFLLFFFHLLVSLWSMYRILSKLICRLDVIIEFPDFFSQIWHFLSLHDSLLLLLVFYLHVDFSLEGIHSVLCLIPDINEYNTLISHPNTTAATSIDKVNRIVV